MTITVSESRATPVRVLIAGAGVAGLETALALHALAPERVAIEILAPEREFAYRPLAVAEPFGLATVRRFELEPIAREAGAVLRGGQLAAVDAERRVATTDAGDELAYDALVLATGTRATAAVPGALTFAGGPSAEAFKGLLEELERAEATSAAFAIPAGVSWSLPMYEAALMTAARLDERGASGGRRLLVVTPEDAPLALFGAEASAEVARLLADAGVRVVASTAPEAFERGRLACGGGREVDVDRVVALPKLTVPRIAGVPQGSDGFVPTDGHGRVDGLAGVYAVGDATWFPIKQGGIATQQADLAAAAIAAEAGAEVDLSDAPLVLRGALLTGARPRFLRNDASGGSVATTAALWWPPGKIAGRYLAPLLARLSRDELPPPPMADLDAVFGNDPEAAEAGHREALALALAAADAEAGWGDTATALRWLDVAEQLNVTLPSEYAQLRERWRGELAGVSG